MADGFKQLGVKDLTTSEGIGELNRMLQTLFDKLAGDGVNQGVYSGSGVPTFYATTGSIYLRRDGGANTSIYVREGTSWTAK